MHRQSFRPRLSSEWLKRIDSVALILEDGLGERQTKWILFCRPGTSGCNRNCRSRRTLVVSVGFFSGALGHHVARFAQNPFKGLALAFRTLHFHCVIRLRNNLLKKITGTQGIETQKWA